MLSILKKIKEKVKPEHKQVAENYLFLSIMNGINILLPLINLPYLVRVLGPEKYGMTVFAYTIALYFMMFTNYGFNLSATRLISIFRENKNRVSVFFSSVTVIRLTIALLGLLILLGLCVIIPKFREDPWLFIFSYGIVLGNALIPVWLFQGMEKMKYVTLVNIITKLLFTLLIFILVKKESDYLYVNLYYSTGFMIAGITSMLISFRIFAVNFRFPRMVDIWYQLRDGFNIFLSTVFIHFYRESNVILLGFFTEYKYVAFYSAAEKIIKSVQAVLSPLTEAIYPYMSKKFSKESLKENIRSLFNFSKYYSLLLLLLSVSIFVFSGIIVKIFLGADYVRSITDMRIMSLVPLFGGLNYVFGILGLLNFNKSRTFLFSVGIAGIISIGLCSLLSVSYQDFGASIAMVSSETILTFIILYHLLRLRKQNSILK